MNKISPILSQRDTLRHRVGGVLTYYGVTLAISLFLLSLIFTGRDLPLLTALSWGITLFVTGVGLMGMLLLATPKTKKLKEYFIWL